MERATIKRAALTAFWVWVATSIIMLVASVLMALVLYALGCFPALWDMWWKSASGIMGQMLPVSIGFFWGMIWTADDKPKLKQGTT